MVAVYHHARDAATYRDALRQVEGGELDGRRCVWWREFYEPSDGTMRLQTRCEGLRMDVIYRCSMRDLLASEPAEQLGADAGAGEQWDLSGAGFAAGSGERETLTYPEREWAYQHALVNQTYRP